MTQVRVIREEGVSVEKMPLSMRSSCKVFSDQWGRAQSMVGGAIPGLVVLGSIRRETEKASKQHPSMASASAPASRILAYLKNEQRYGSGS